MSLLPTFLGYVVIKTEAPSMRTEKPTVPTDSSITGCRPGQPHCRCERDQNSMRLVKMKRSSLSLFIMFHNILIFSFSSAEYKMVIKWLLTEETPECSTGEAPNRPANNP